MVQRRVPFVVIDMATLNLPPALRKWEPLITETAARYGLSPALLAGLVQMESGGQPGAVSAAGAVGLGQVMPAEAGFTGRPTRDQLLDPATNLDWSARILSDNIKRWGAQDKGIAAYLGAIDRNGNIVGGDPYTGISGSNYVWNVLTNARTFSGQGDSAMSGDPGIDNPPQYPPAHQKALDAATKYQTAKERYDGLLAKVQEADDPTLAASEMKDEIAIAKARRDEAKVEYDQALKDDPITPGNAQNPKPPTGTPPKGDDPVGTKKQTIIDGPNGSKLVATWIADGKGNWSIDPDTKPSTYLEGTTPSGADVAAKNAQTTYYGQLAEKARLDALKEQQLQTLREQVQQQLQAIQSGDPAAKQQALADLAQSAAMLESPDAVLRHIESQATQELTRQRDEETARANQAREQQAADTLQFQKEQEQQRRTEAERTFQETSKQNQARNAQSLLSLQNERTQTANQAQSEYDQYGVGTPERYAQVQSLFKPLDTSTAAAAVGTTPDDPKFQQLWGMFQGAQSAQGTPGGPTPPPPSAPVGSSAAMPATPPAPAAAQPVAAIVRGLNLGQPPAAGYGTDTQAPATPRRPAILDTLAHTLAA